MNNEERVQQYVGLIQELLSCPNGEEANILSANMELVDLGLVAVMGQYADYLREQGQAGAADFLVDMAAQITNFLQQRGGNRAVDRNTLFNFLMEVLQAVNENNDPRIIYPLLAAHQDKLTLDIAAILQQWTLATLSETSDPSEAYGICAVIGNFAELIRQFPHGNRAINLEIAITANQTMLGVFTRSQYPAEWAATQNNLAIGYSKRLKGDRAENIEIAISYFLLALEVRTREDFPEDWAATHNNLAIDYKDRLKGDRAENIEMAIQCFLLALEVRTREDFPEDWAATHNNLANAYSERLKGDRAENIEMAIQCFLLALEVRTHEDFPEDWAMTQNNLAIAYKDRLKGDRAENIEEAIARYHLALEVYTREDFPEDWAMTQNNLANAYSDRLKGDRAEDIEEAIARYHLALEVYTREDFRENWAATQNNLANAYYTRLKGDRAENIEMAIASCRLASKVYTHEDFPEDWAMTQNNLATAYKDRLKGDRVENIEMAIASYRLTLEVRTREDFPVDCAATQNNLGVAYSERLKGDRAENIEIAITFYLLALEVRTREDFREDWAMTQNNLANAYKDRLKGDRAENIEEAIARYHFALEVYTREDFREKWAATQNNLANAYYARLKGDRAENIEEAIARYHLALEVRTREDFREDWAATQNNLANAYYARLKGDRAENIEEAIARYHLALEVRTREDFREDWAMTQNNLATAYKDRLKGDRAENIEEAIARYHLALEVRTSEAFPNDCLQTGRNLGNLGFKEGMWQLAITGYVQAIEAVETSRSWTKDETRREEIHAESIEIYSNIVQAYINLNQYAQAFSYVERSRSKRLLDLMHVHDFYKNGEIPPEVQEILDQIDNHQSEIDKIYHPYNQTHNLATADSLRYAPKDHEKAKIDYHRREINRLYQEVRQRDPLAAAGTRVAPIDLDAIAQLLQGSTTTALLNFYSTTDNTYIFILRHDPNSSNSPSPNLGEGQGDALSQSKGVRVDLHVIPDQGIDKLHDWIFDEWIAQSQNNRQQWATNAPNFLTELSQKLQLNHLITAYLQNITELILIPHLYLHQIPFIALPIDPPQPPLSKGGEETVPLAKGTENSQVPLTKGDLGGSYLGDHFTIRYAPSCQVLQFCQIRDPIPEPLTYGLIAGASRDVPYAQFQGDAIAKLRKIPPNNHLKGINQATKAAYKQLIHQVNIFHVYHHGNFDFGEPLNASLTAADGDITLAQILTWRLPQLSDIFLSCCETGLGLSKKLTDDIFAIASGFLCVGARTVFGTLWSVEQLSAALICVLYYRDRSENPHHRKAQSLQIAQTQLREMSGAQIEAEFGDALEDSIQDYIKQLRDYTLSLPEGTSARETAQTALDEAKNGKYEDGKFQPSLETNLFSVFAHPRPFENPTYWAAFTCQGLG
ncbi:MAG: CHAT domain-containing tetratricopeptide repeat protein [Pseudanabaenaceae cyanobacterium bins.39]|nr:CHAT domain-containing tetratricopeptide repeat protein [Pseudanabaenaceae cyanobacterium bins.39]